MRFSGLILGKGTLPSLNLITQSLLKEPFGLLPSNITTHNFIDLDPIANAYYEIAAPITFAGDFEVEVEFSTTSTKNENILLGKINDARGFLRLGDGTPSLNFSQAGNAVYFGTNKFNDGKLHLLKLEVISGVINLFVDGVLQGTTTPADISNTNFDAIGHKAGQFFDGIIANAKITDKSGASDVVTTFRLDNSPAAENYTYSTELLDNNTFPDNANARQYLVSSKGWIITDGGAA